jgi:hypothetical protein
MTKRFLILLGAMSFLLVATVAASAADIEFTGAGKCKMCHNKEKSGKQYDIWAAGSHAKAYEVLASEASLAIAKERGIADPQKADECLKCHITAFGVDAALLGKKYDMTEGVSCESCHGAGGEYQSMKTMKAITAGEIDGATVGLVQPDEALCVGCHNEESPTYKPFDYAEAVKMIAHPIPEEHLATYKK